MRNCRRFNRIYGLQLRDICTAKYFVLHCSWFVNFVSFFFFIFSVELNCPYQHSTIFSLSSSHILLIKSCDKYRILSNFRFILEPGAPNDNIWKICVRKTILRSRIFGTCIAHNAMIATATF